MRKLVVLVLFAVASGTVACKKKEAGVCYCKYVSGDKKEFDLKSLSRSAAIDSCAVLDKNANGFGGECDLK